jgi:hypothetical protein
VFPPSFSDDHGIKANAYSVPLPIQIQVLTISGTWDRHAEKSAEACETLALLASTEKKTKGLTLSVSGDLGTGP